MAGFKAFLNPHTQWGAHGALCVTGSEKTCCKKGINCILNVCVDSHPHYPVNVRLLPECPFTCSFCISCLSTELLDPFKIYRYQLLSGFPDSPDIINHSFSVLVPYFVYVKANTDSFYVSWCFKTFTYIDLFNFHYNSVR